MSAALRQVPSVTSYAPVNLLTAWFKAAGPGANVQFAAGAEVDWTEPAAALVKGWIDDGAVTRHQQGRDGNGAARHIVKRAFPPLAATRSAREPDFDATPEGRVFRLIEEAALDGVPCPTNAQIAELADLRDRDAASYRIKRLVEMGRLRVENPDTALAHRAGRVATIVASGLSTARWRV